MRTRPAQCGGRRQFWAGGAHSTSGPTQWLSRFGRDALNGYPGRAQSSRVLPKVRRIAFYARSTRFSRAAGRTTSAARAALRKTWFAGRARAAAIWPEQVAAFPALLLGGSVCRLPALPSQHPTPRQLAVLAWPRVHKAADWADVESRFGRHFPAVEGRKTDMSIAAFALDALCAFKRVLPVNFCTRVYCGPARLFRSVIRKDTTRVIWHSNRTPNGPE